MKNVLTILLISLLIISCNSEKTSEDIKYEEAQRIIANHSSFPNFELPNKAEEVVKSSQFEDGYVFYMIWGSWCSSCVDNIVAVRDMKKKGLLENIQFVSISVDEDKEKWERFLYQYDMEDYMANVLMGRDSENILNNFRYKEMINSKREKVYNYMTPAYCLVKNGIIIDNSPILPEDRNKFLEQFG